MENNIKVVIGAVMGVAIIGIGAYFILQEPEKPSTEQANLILDKAVEKTLALDSFTTIGNASFQIKDGEIVLFGVTMRDTEMSIINPFDFANQGLSMAVIYDVAINFEAIAGLVEARMPPEELEELRAGPMGMDPLEIIRGIGEANISVTTEMRSIDFDSYMKIAKVDGLREVITQAGGAFIAEMAMAEIEPYLGIWHKTPADSAVLKEMTATFKGIENSIQSLFDAYYVREILPNTEVNGIPVYNFALGIDLEKMKDVVISFIPLIAEEVEMGINEKEEIKAGIIEASPKITKAIEAMNIDFRAYICQETHFIIKDTGKVNVDLYALMVALKPIITTEMTLEEITEFETTKEMMRGISLVITTDFIYSDHNTVPAITPPAEYQVIE